MLVLYFDRMTVIMTAPIVKLVRLHLAAQRLLAKISNSLTAIEPDSCVTSMTYTNYATSPSWRVPLNWLNIAVVFEVFLAHRVPRTGSNAL